VCCCSSCARRAGACAFALMSTDLTRPFILHAASRDELTASVVLHQGGWKTVAAVSSGAAGTVEGRCTHRADRCWARANSSLEVVEGLGRVECVREDAAWLAAAHTHAPPTPPQRSCPARLCALGVRPVGSPEASHP
jgi:hypothetical protein